MADPAQTTQTEAGLNELERLRDILYGQQARSTEERLKALSDRLEKIKAEMSARIDALDNQLTARLEALQAELTERLENQQSSQSQATEANRKALAAQLSQLHADATAQISGVQKSLEKSNAELLNLIQSLQAASRDADAELAALINLLEDNKISRQTFSQMLVELAERLAQQPT